MKNEITTHVNKNNLHEKYNTHNKYCLKILTNTN